MIECRFSLTQDDFERAFKPCPQDDWPLDKPCRCGKTPRTHPEHFRHDPDAFKRMTRHTAGQLATAIDAHIMELLTARFK